METAKQEIAILNILRGDLTIAFDPADAEEAKEAERQIRDLMRRGYLLTVPHGKGWRKIEAFDPKKGTYRLARTASEAATEVEATKVKPTAIAPVAGG